MVEKYEINLFSHICLKMKSMNKECCIYEMLRVGLPNSHGAGEWLQPPPTSPRHGVAQRLSCHSAAPRSAQQCSHPQFIPPSALSTRTAWNTELISNLATELHFLLSAVTARHSSRGTVLCVVLTLLIVFGDTSKWLVVSPPR